MVGHDGISANMDGEHLGQFEDPGSDPVTPVRKVPPGPGINPAQKLAPYAARDDVVVGRGVQRYELAAWHGHGGLAEPGLEKQASGRAVIEL